VYWTTCSSPSTKLGPRHLGKDKSRSVSFTLFSPTFARQHLLTLTLLILTSVWFAISTSAATPKPVENKKQVVATQPVGVFGSLEFKTNATKGLAEWQRVQKQMSGEERIYADCDSGLATCPSYLRNWRRNLKSWSSVNETLQLELVNSWVNRTIRYTEDANAFGQRDYWASPKVSLKGRGDCEDYAIAKYASLKALGFGEDRMRIVIVNDTRKRIGHAVLSVKTMDGIYILDNQNIRPVLHQRISYYAPVYSINAAGRWINIATRQIKTQYAKTFENGSDPALGKKPVKQAKVAREIKSASPDAELPLELILRPSFAARELGPITAAAGQENAQPEKDWARDRL
jgi:predicted transglutaminase-like cysteine proteinase